MNKNALNEIENLNWIFYPLSNNKEHLDARIRGLINGVDIVGKKIIDSSTLTGSDSCILSELGAVVTASDIRPKNLSMCLYRALYKGIDNIKYRCIDLEEMHKFVDKDEYDIHFFTGSFYHLKNPVEVFNNIAQLFEWTLLETHIADPLIHKIIDKYGYQGCEYQEGGWEDPFSSKDLDNSFWLTRESLKKLISDCGLVIHSDIYTSMKNDNGPRDCYLLKRV